MTLDNKNVTPSDNDVPNTRGLKILVVGLGIAIIGMVVLIIGTAISQLQEADEDENQRVTKSPGIAFPPKLVTAPNGSEFEHAIVTEGKLLLQFRGADGETTIISIDAATGAQDILNGN